MSLSGAYENLYDGSDLSHWLQPPSVMLLLTNWSKSSRLILLHPTRRATGSPSVFTSLNRVLFSDPQVGRGLTIRKEPYGRDFIG